MTDSKVLLRLEFSKKVQNSKLKAFLPLTERERNMCVFLPTIFCKGKKGFSRICSCQRIQAMCESNSFKTAFIWNQSRSLNSQVSTKCNKVENVYLNLKGKKEQRSSITSLPPSHTPDPLMYHWDLFRNQSLKVQGPKVGLRPCDLVVVIFHSRIGGNLSHMGRYYSRPSPSLYNFWLIIVFLRLYQI